MSAHPQTSARLMASTPIIASPEEICAFRGSAHANGYRLVRVATRQKRPIAHKWSEGESLAALMKFELGSANTGLVLEGLRAFDLDIDDPELASAVTALLFKYAPRHNCLIRKRMGSSRIAVLYRAAEGAPGKRSVCSRKERSRSSAAVSNSSLTACTPAGCDFTGRTECRQQSCL